MFSQANKNLKHVNYCTKQRHAIKEFGMLENADSLIEYR